MHILLCIITVHGQRLSRCRPGLNAYRKSVGKSDEISNMDGCGEGGGSGGGGGGGGGEGASGQDAHRRISQALAG